MTNECDYLIATHILGWKLVDKAWIGKHGYYKCRQSNFKPSTNIVQAFEVVDEYLDAKYNVQIDYIPDVQDSSGEYMVAIYGSSEYTHSRQQTLALALSDAVLKHKGVIVYI